MKLANGVTGHTQLIGVILCNFPNFTIIYPEGKVYYCPVHPFNTISLGALKFYIGFQKFTSEPLEHFDFVEPQGRYWISSYHNQKNIYYLQINIIKVNPQRNSNIVTPTGCDLLKKISISLFISAIVVSLFPG